MEDTTLEEKSAHLSEAAAAERISRAIWKVSIGFADNTEEIKQFTHPIAENQIPSSSIRRIDLFGYAGKCCNSAMTSAGLHPGVYTNNDGDWLILIHPKDQDIYEYTDRCAEQLRSLSIYNARLSTLNLSHLTNLIELRIRECNRLAVLLSMDQLTQLKV